MSRASIGSAPFRGQLPPATRQLTSANVFDQGEGYQPGDTITLAGGSYDTPAIIGVTQIILRDPGITDPGVGYTVGDLLTITLSLNTWRATVTGTGALGIITGIAVTSQGLSDTPDIGDHAIDGGTGTGARLQFGIRGAYAYEIVDTGQYRITPPDPVAQLATDGAGTAASVQATWT